MRIVLQGQRTHCRTGVTKDVRLVLKDYWNSSKYMREWWVYISDGGVTGYESIKVDTILNNDELEENSFDIITGWYACAGTKNSWDTLFIPGIELLQLKEALQKEYV